MLSIAICDDNKNTLLTIRGIVDDYINKNKIIAKVTVYQKSQLLIYDLQEGVGYDLLLLDIEMPEIDGIQVASRVQQYQVNAKVIFITSHLKYTLESFELSIFRYIPKNNISERLEPALRDAINLIQVQDEAAYIINVNKRYEKLLYKDIYYIYKDRKNSVIVTVNGMSKIRKSLGQVYSELNQEEFIYIDRGYIVNIIHIMKISNYEVALKDGTLLPISKSHLKEVKNTINTYWGNYI